MIQREFSSGGILIKKGKSGLKILLIKDGYGRWTWPKGNIEEGETSQDAAKREIYEEVGLTNIRLIEKVDKIKYFYHLHGRPVFKTVDIYLFEVNGDEGLKVLKSEIDDAQWLLPQEALARIEYKGAKKILKTAIDKFKEINCIT